MKLVSITQGRSVLVDDQDFVWLSKFSWSLAKRNGKEYAVRGSTKGGKKTFYMHREILGLSANEEADHIDANGLNNQRHNLRKCTHGENTKSVTIHYDNKSGLKGAWKRGGTKNHSKPWFSQIRVGEHRIHLGVFRTDVEAATAYDSAAIKYFGQFAKTNASMGLIPCRLRIP